MIALTAIIAKRERELKLSRIKSAEDVLDCIWPPLKEGKLRLLSMDELKQGMEWLAKKREELQRRKRGDNGQADD